jgi:hypothetical protein
VIGVGIGPRIRNGEPVSDELCVRFYVEKKIRPLEAIDQLYRIPEKLVGDVPTDVVEAGRFVSLGYHGAPGGSIGVDYDAPNIDPGMAGTLGAIVRVGGIYYALGSNHVIAVNGRVPIGQRVMFNPSGKFVVSPSEYIFARLSAYVYLRPEGPDYDSKKPNRVDCALAKVEHPDRVTGEAPDRIFDSSDLQEPKPGDLVGRVDESDKATGVIQEVEARVRIAYPFGTFDFDDMVLIGGYDNRPFANPGDSGALIVNRETKKPTAMVVGGSQNFTVACKLSHVREELGKDLVERKQVNPEERAFDLVLDKLPRQEPHAAHS